MLRACLAFLLLSFPALADAPKVAADIAPVHALVARVMQGIGAPELIVAANASPHGYALRPSQARALQEADLVVWIGPDLTPWMEKPLRNLASGAEVLTLLDAPKTQVLAYRGGPDHDHGDHAHESGGHDHGAADRDHGVGAHESGEEGHDQGSAGHDHGVDAGGTDPHAWLDPENARHWLALIAERLAAADPENAAGYRANAAEGIAELEALEARIAARLAPLAAVPFVTFHDAYQYFETRFGLSFAGSVALGDATDPGPARLADLQREMQERGVRCAFREPQFDDRRLRALTGNGGLTVAELDPMGSMLTPGPDLYPALLWQMAEAFAACLGS